MRLIPMITKSSCLSLLLLLLFTACTKDSLKVESNHFPNANDVVLENGELHFPDQEAFDRVYHFIQNSGQSEIISWQNQLGFHSVNLHYYAAKEFLGVNESQEGWARLKTKYNGLIIIEGDKIRPRLELGHFGWFIGAKNQMRVGKSIVYYTADGYSISVSDGDEDKLTRAIQTRKADPENGVYAHPVILKEANLRNCGFSYGASNVRSDNDQRKLDMGIELLDNSYGYSSGMMVNVSSQVYFEHKKRAWLGIWNADPTIFTYDATISGSATVYYSVGISNTYNLSLSTNDYSTGNLDSYESTTVFINAYHANAYQVIIGLSGIGLHLDHTSEPGDSIIEDINASCN